MSRTTNNARVLSTTNYNLKIESNEENLDKNNASRVKRNASKVQFATTPNCDHQPKSNSRERDGSQTVVDKACTSPFRKCEYCMAKEVSVETLKIKNPHIIGKDPSFFQRRVEIEEERNFD